MSASGEGSSTLTTHGGALPAETSRFFGRSQEAAAIKDALGRSRLVTLTGPGGVGKTRLAVKVAGELAHAFPDGVYVADLSAARDAGGVARATGAALGPLSQGPPGAGAEPRPAGWPARLRDRRLLLILDTAEHVLDACAALADAMLRAGNGPVLLVTSRQPLDLPGEVVFRIQPLGVAATARRRGGPAVRRPGRGGGSRLPGHRRHPAEAGAAVPAARRHAAGDRARRAAAAGSQPRRAARQASRPPAAARRRPPGGGGDRQQSLRASIAWSYDLCSPAERLLWARLSVFAGDFDLAAAEAVRVGTLGAGGGVGGGGSAGGELRPGRGPRGAGRPGGQVGGAARGDAGGTARYRLPAIVREHGAEHAPAPGGRRPARGRLPGCGGRVRRVLRRASPARPCRGARQGRGQPAARVRRRGRRG